MGEHLCACAQAALGGPTPFLSPPLHPRPTPLLTPTLQVAGAVSSLFILIIIVKLGELFRDLPKVSGHIQPARLEGLGQARGKGQSGPKRGAGIQGGA